jgi:hypothetical protein
MPLVSCLQDIDIAEKVKNAPDSSYEIGVFIGSMIPFIVLVLLAYLVFNYNKNKNLED